MGITMQICRMNYNDLSDNGRKAKFHCYGVDIFDVFSGQDPYVNKSECSYIEKSAIPPGQYWIVDRPVGSIANQVRGTALDMIHGTNHSQWFGLYSFQTMNDYIFVNGVRRGAFRLHPLRPNGSGESWGCITFYRVSDFNIVRNALLRTHKFKVPGSSLMAYGRVDVTGNTNFGACKVS
ncbi:DUF2778 domain-containing protein [Photorhabdus sp. S15-56]|nr:DUF2778 domain-containing protein [Photorhabdus sp. S14-60]RAW74814.1 DUF2778 domain-containing protein [Photorhabdus sp. S7-51]RAW80135.1 DUF2778 domain-containing protein [Photorhabdus sp. S15-56]